MKYLCDFHLHSCLSPCGDPGLTPAALAHAAKAAGLDAHMADFKAKNG